MKHKHTRSVAYVSVPQKAESLRILLPLHWVHIYRGGGPYISLYGHLNSHWSVEIS